MRKAFVVGIDDYPQQPLTGCCNDANEIAELLSKHGNQTPNFDVKVNNNIYSKAELKGAISECFDGDSDVALLYYSGHGYLEKGCGYLVTPDYSENDLGVSLDDVLKIVNTSMCRNKIVILDTCHSGSMGCRVLDCNHTTEISDGVTILTACRAHEQAVELDNHGLFTTLLLSAFSGGAADIMGHITPGGIYAYIDKALGPWDQRPVFKTNVSRFVSLRDVVPQVDIAILRKICQYFETEDSLFNLDPSYEPTNCIENVHTLIEPHANPENTRIFSELQKLEGIGIIVPVGEEHMYYAAMNSKACKLTPMGQHYWRLARDNRI